MSEELFTREEIMAGLPARRASTLLFLIESRTAHLVAQSRQAMERFLTEEAAEERDLAFLEAFALGRDPPLRIDMDRIDDVVADLARVVLAIETEGDYDRAGALLERYGQVTTQERATLDALTDPSTGSGQALPIDIEPIYPISVQQ
ncbi:MAG: hypothetical protein H8E90_00785 [Anaerolineales bacterium]|nr:hypothetical protein [Anaerolineales bacterium]